MKSIIQSEKVCYITGRTDMLEEHLVPPRWAGRAEP